MSGIPMVTQRGQRTYTAVETVLGGQLVEGRTGGIGVAGAGSANVLGVAIIDAQPTAAGAGAATIDATGRALLSMSVLPTVTTVVSSGTEVPVTYAAAAACGQALVAAAGGAVTPADAGSTAAQIVGRCVAPGGVAAGARGLMRTN